MINISAAITDHKSVDDTNGPKVNISCNNLFISSCGNYGGNGVGHKVFDMTKVEGGNFTLILDSNELPLPVGNYTVNISYPGDSLVLCR